MNLNLPYCKTRRYLTGVDWIVNTFHRMTEVATGAGNVSQIVLELAGVPATALLASRLEAACRRFPLLGGRPARDWTLAPCWRVPPRPGLPPPWRILETHLPDPAPEAAVTAALTGPLNTPFAHPAEHLVFHIVREGTRRTWLGMTFDHRLFDARGAETFLDLLETAWGAGGDPEIAARVAVTEPAHLDRWMEKFQSGQQVNRKFLALRGKDFAFLRQPAICSPHSYHFHLLHLSEEQSRAFSAAADREAGPLMLMPYALAATVELLHPVFQRRGLAGAEYLVPVSLDARPPGKKWEHLFFNHLSFLFFEVPAVLSGDRPRLLDLLVNQFYEQVKSGIPAHIARASVLMRIAPLWLTRRGAKWPLRGELGSFCFASVGAAGLSHPTFLGLPLRNLFHMPRVPPPPGIGLFFNQFDNRFNITLSLLDGLLEAGEERELVERLRARFGGP